MLLDHLALDPRHLVGIGAVHAGVHELLHLDAQLPVHHVVVHERRRQRREVLAAERGAARLVGVRVGGRLHDVRLMQPVGDVALVLRLLVGDGLRDVAEHLHEAEAARGHNILARARGRQAEHGVLGVLRVGRGLQSLRQFVDALRQHVHFLVGLPEPVLKCLDFGTDRVRHFTPSSGKFCSVSVPARVVVKRRSGRVTPSTTVRPCRSSRRAP